jgi:uncharacterized membrane protein
MFLYAAFLLLCGLIAFAWSGFAANAKTALIVGGATAVVMALCAWLASMLHRNRAAGMIGVHAGLILPLVFAALFGWRAFKTFTGGDASKQYLAVILSIMAVGSVIAFIAILKTRPPASQRT